MNTYVTVHVSSEGAKASEVAKVFQDLGFETTLGGYDFVYAWKDKHVTPEKVVDFVDKVQDRLNGMGVLLHFVTTR